MARERRSSWIAIVCTDDMMWAALATEIGAQALAALSVDERHARHDELDELIEQWTQGHDGDEAMHRLQQLGIAAHTVQHSPELVADPQLSHRGHFVEVSHAKSESFVVEGSRFRLSRTPTAITSAGPTYGEHTFDILSDVLAYDSDKIAELAAAELFE